MFPSLYARVVVIGPVVVIALASLASLLVGASRQTSESFRWVTHSADVIEAINAAFAELLEAESGQRGFILTRNPSYVKTGAAISGS